MLIDVERLCISFQSKDNRRVHAVRDVSFSMEQGSRLGIVGSSGSGKTRTALALLGLVKGYPGVVDGRVSIHGQNIYEGIERYLTFERDTGVFDWLKPHADWVRVIGKQAHPVRGRVVGMIFQEPRLSLSPYFTVRKQFEDTLERLSGEVTEADIEGQVIPLLKRMYFDDVTGILNAYPHQLSGGESQRIMIALALMGEPDLLIADEPTTSLDLVTRNEIIQLINEVVEERNMALLIISHDLSVMAQTVDRLLVMQDGCIVERGRLTDVLQADPESLSEASGRLKRSTARILAGGERI